MARTTDKHTPRFDDQLAHEEHALTHGAPDEGWTEARRLEAPGPGEGGVGMRPEAEDRADGAPPQSEVEARAALAATFDPSSFPARRDQLVARAQERFADDSLIDALRALPDDVYDSPGQVWDALHADS